jgi:hypothetical protein
MYGSRNVTCCPIRDLEQIWNDHESRAPRRSSGCPAPTRGNVCGGVGAILRSGRPRERRRGSSIPMPPRHNPNWARGYRRTRDHGHGGDRQRPNLVTGAFDRRIAGSPGPARRGNCYRTSTGRGGLGENHRLPPHPHKHGTPLHAGCASITRVASDRGGRVSKRRMRPGF